MSSMLSSKSGDIAEQQAANLLLRKGLKILKRNYRAPRGEIDIVAEDQGTLVFVEVRLRTDISYGRPDESINRRKQQSIIRAAEHYLANGTSGNNNTNKPCRFDAVCLTPEVGQNEVFVMEWLRDAFRVEAY